VTSVVSAAIRIGHERVDVRDLARACGAAPRTVHWRLTTTPMTARRLLAWSLVLHAAWRRECNGWNIKRAAHAAGFGSRDAFANYIQRNARMRASELSAPGTVRRLGDRFLEEVGGPVIGVPSSTDIARSIMTLRDLTGTAPNLGVAD
jgi:hypothetical protein